MQMHSSYLNSISYTTIKGSLKHNGDGKLVPFGYDFAKKNTVWQVHRKEKTGVPSSNFLNVGTFFKQTSIKVATVRPRADWVGLGQSG